MYHYYYDFFPGQKAGCGAGQPAFSVCALLAGVINQQEELRNGSIPGLVLGFQFGISLLLRKLGEN